MLGRISVFGYGGLGGFHLSKGVTDNYLRLLWKGLARVC